MTAQDAVLLRTEARDRGARLMVHEMRAELDRDRIELLERMAEQQQLRLGIQGGALHALCIPRVADFEPAISANPYIQFHFRAMESGPVVLTWTDDDGSKIVGEEKITVS